MAGQATKFESRLMGEMHEGKLLMKLAVPMILSMLVQALYNIVDSIYVAQVSEDCLSALSLAFPAQNIMIGLATGTGVGVSTLISRALGRGDRNEASRTAGTAIFLSACCWGLMALFGIFGAEAFIHSQTEVQSIRSYASAYLRIVTIGSLFIYLEVTAERFLQSTGMTKLSMWTQMIGIRPYKDIIASVYRIGFPSIVMMVVGSLTNYLMNIILGSFTSTAVAVYGVYFKIQSFFFMPVFGINNGLIPIIGYNYGARKKERIYNTIRYGVIFASCFMFLGFLAFQLFPKLLLGIFNPSEAMLAIGIPALRRISPSFLFAGFCIVAGSACQALDRSVNSLIVSVLRQILALIPAAWLLAQTGNVNNVWWCFPIAEIVSLTASAFFLRSALKAADKKLSQEAN